MSANEKPAHSPLTLEESESLSIGRIEITDEVIASIAARAAAKIEGVFVVGSSFAFSEFFTGKENPGKGVHVRINEQNGHATINVEVNMCYGVVIYEAARQLQLIIKDEVESLTGSMNVDKVNIRVRQIVMQEEEQPRETIPPDQATEEDESL